MPDVIKLWACGFLWLCVFLLAMYFDHRITERQHKRHKEEIASLFDDFRGWLYNDIVNYFEGLM